MKSCQRSLNVISLLLIWVNWASAFTTDKALPSFRPLSSSSNDYNIKNSRPNFSSSWLCAKEARNELVEETRRNVLIQSVGFFMAATTALPKISNAAQQYPQENSDKEKINKGYDRLVYLLDNWESLTTVCKRNDNPYIGCERTPEKVMEYLGYKSMEDPLFRADKTLIRLQNLVPAKDNQAQSDYQDALDIFIEKAEEGNGMAYISSWGEANPGGGKDRVAMFIERSKKDVIEAKDALATVKRVLKF